MATRLQHPFMMAGFMILLTPCNAEDTVPAIHYLMNEGPGGELRNGTGKTLAGTVAAAAWASGAQRSVLLLDGRKTFATVDGGEGLTFPGGHTADLWFWPDRPIQGGPFGLAVKSSTFRILVTPVVDKLKFLIDLTSGAGKGRVYESFEADGDEQQWHHIALTYSQDTQTTRFHLNGEVIFEKQQDIGKLGHGKTLRGDRRDREALSGRRILEGDLAAADRQAQSALVGPALPQARPEKHHADEDGADNRHQHHADRLRPDLIEKLGDEHEEDDHAKATHDGHHVPILTAILAQHGDESIGLAHRAIVTRASARRPMQASAASTRPTCWRSRVRPSNPRSAPEHRD